MSAKGACELVAEGITFTYPTESSPDVDGADITLKSGHVYGLFGCNASGKSTLARVLTGSRKPQRGTIHFLVDGKAAEEPDAGDAPAGLHTDGAAPGTVSRCVQHTEAMLYSTLLLSACMLAGAAVLLGSTGSAKGGVPPWLRALGVTPRLVPALRRALGERSLLATLAMGVLLPLLLLGYASLQSRSRKAAKLVRHGARVVHIHSEDDPGHRLAMAQPELTIAQCLRGMMVRELARDEATARRAALSLLRVSGFQMFNEKGEKVGSAASYYDDGIKLAKCSGGQKHLIYVLRMLASCAPVLVLDEVLGGLDQERRTRVLYMLRTLCASAHQPLPASFAWVPAGTAPPAVLCITTDLHELGAMTMALVPAANLKPGVALEPPRVAFMHEAKICERGLASHMLTRPSHPKAQEYVLAFRSMMKDPSLLFGAESVAQILALDLKAINKTD